MMDIYLDTFGTKVSKDLESFLITNDATSKCVPAEHVRALHVSKGVTITSDAVFLAIANDIQIYFVNGVGKPEGTVWSSKYGSISTIRKGQLAFSQSTSGMDWVRDVLSEKISAQVATLAALQKESKYPGKLDKYIYRMKRHAIQVKELDMSHGKASATKLRGFEGMTSRLYFEAFNMLIPLQYRFKDRTQHPAKDVTNALLNYGYGILYGMVETALIKAGVDPYVGILHRDSYNKPVLVYDVIEPYRVWVDQVVFYILNGGLLTDDCCQVSESGAYLLEASGRHLLVQSLNDFMDEVIKINRSVRSRANHIVQDAQRIAKLFKKYAEE